MVVESVMMGVQDNYMTWPSIGVCILALVGVVVVFDLVHKWRVRRANDA
jgi:hypothetical protein